MAKTQEQRAIDINKILSDIDNRELIANNGNIPDDIKDISLQLQNYKVKELIPDSFVINSKVESIEKKNKQMMYQIFTTGFGLANVKRAGNRLVRVKLQIFLE